MAGGLFGRPFAINPKCSAFSVLSISLFLWCPRFSSATIKWMCIAIIFIVSYVAMAWYDYFFDCQTLPLKRGPDWGVTQVFKPPAHTTRQEVAPPRKNPYMTLVYGLHLLIIAPLLGYVAYKGRRAPRSTWAILGTVAVLTAGYHGARLLNTLHIDQKENSRGQKISDQHIDGVVGPSRNVQE